MAITGRGRNPTHHTTFGDGKTRVGFVFVEPSGERNERVFRRFPKVDPSQPYVTETQADWGGGLGNANFEDDRSKFWRSQGVDTLKGGAITLGPQVRYADGVRAANYLLPTGKFHWREVSESARFRAQSFVGLSGGYPAVYIKFWVRKIGKPGNLLVYLKEDSGGNPGSTVASATLTPAQVNDFGDSVFVKVAIASSSIAGGTTYWIVWDGGAVVSSGKDRWEIGCDPDATGGKISANGSAWSTPSGNEGYFFRIADADLPYVPYFYPYKGQLYMAMEYDDKDGTTTKILMNGYRGACDANAGDKTKLNDATQTFDNNIVAGAVARVVSGQATGEIEDWRKVVSGTTGAMTMEYPWLIPHTTGCDYVVLGTNYWQEVAKPFSGGWQNSQVSGVAVAKGGVYFCRGTKLMYVHRQYNDNGNWTADDTAACWRKTGVKSHHVVVMTDPVSGPVLWFGSNLGRMGRYRPEVFRAIPVEWGDNNLNRVSIEDFETEWTTAASTVESLYKPPPINQQGFRIKIGVVQTINTTPTAAGSGYAVNDILTIDEAGSGKNATVKVTAIGGGGSVTTLQLESGGWDYTVGAGKATTGGAGTGCTVEITAIQSFSTGLVAYKGLSEEADIRYANRMRFWMQSPGKVLNAGDMALLLDDSPFAASPVLTVSIPKLKPDVWHDLDIEYDASEIAGANEIESVGLQLNATKTKTFEVTLIKEIYAVNDFDPIEVGEDADNINGLEVWGDPESLWVLTETGLGEIRNNTYLPAPLRELKITRHPNTGKGHTVNDVYLYFTWRGKLQRYFRQNLENLGPDWPKDWGNIRGNITDIATYAGRVYCAMDGGPSRPSQVLCYKGNSWHEIYTSETGERIRKLFIQNIPGVSDRLWFGVGGDLCWLPITDNAVDLPYGTDYRYRHEGYLEFSWVHTSRLDLQKLFKSVTIFADNLAKTGATPNAFVDSMYLLDEDTGEYNQIDILKHGPHKEFDLDSGTPPASISGHRLRLRLRIRTRDLQVSPVVRRVTYKIYQIPEVKFSYTFITKLSTLSINLLGDEEKVVGVFDSVKEAINQLDTWAKSLTPLYVTSDVSVIDKKIVVIEPMPSQLLTLVPDEDIEEESVQITANDI